MPHYPPYERGSTYPSYLSTLARYPFNPAGMVPSEASLGVDASKAAVYKEVGLKQIGARRKALRIISAQIFSPSPIKTSPH